MIDLQLLAKRGCSAKDLRPVFEAFELDKPPLEEKAKDRHEKITNLRNRVRSRIMQGRDWNISNYKVFHALDIAWNIPFKQISPTLLQSLVGAEAGDEAVIEKLKNWGFDSTRLFESLGDDPKTGKPIQRLNVPAFFQIFVPLVRAYVTIRWAKIVNDRRLIPFFKFEPAVTTKKNRVRCEVLTNRIEVMSRQMGYFEVMKQSVFQMLHYGFCLKFPKEQWWDERQELGGSDTALASDANDSVPKPDMEATATVSTDDEMTVVEKEGIRYHMPHPARTFWDQAHRISTFNSDNGCEFAGYWRVCRYRDIAGNKNFWCTDKVGFGSNDWWSSTQGINTYWTTVFKGCTMNWPQSSGTASEGNKDRETKLSYNFYNQAEFGDTSCTLTEYFEKLIPSEWGLGDYNHPVWFRFVVAGDTATIIYAAPLAYAPVIAYVYDADENRDINASLSLEILPFQDQFSNLMTQYLLTVQRNLDNATFIDTDQVQEDDIKKIENAGERLWRSRTFIRYSNKRNMRAQQSIPNAVYHTQFAQLDQNSILQAMNSMLQTLERTLVMSSQELAQAASHELREKEVINIQQQMSVRLQFTTTPVDLASEAWKRQLYAGTMAYGAEEFYSHIAYDKEITPELLKELGFATVETDGETISNRRAIVKGNRTKMRLGDGRTAIMLESFAATRDGNDRVHDSEGATALMQMLMAFANTEYGASFGAVQFFELINQIGHRTGTFDDDFNLKPVFDPTKVMQQKMELEAKGGQSAQQPNPAQQIGPMLQMLEQKIMENVGQAIKPLGDTVEKTVQGLHAFGTMLDKIGQAIGPIGKGVQQNTQEIQVIAQAIKSLEEHLAGAPSLTPTPPVPPAPPVSKSPLQPA